MFTRLFQYLPNCFGTSPRLAGIDHYSNPTRPVALTSILCKCMERVVCQQLLGELEGKLDPLTGCLQIKERYWWLPLHHSFRLLPQNPTGQKKYLHKILHPLCTSCSQKHKTDYTVFSYFTCFICFICFYPLYCVFTCCLVWGCFLMPEMCVFKCWQKPWYKSLFCFYLKQTIKLSKYAHVSTSCMIDMQW